MLRGLMAAKRPPPSNKPSTRSVFLLNEFSKDETLSLDPDTCSVEFPDSQTCTTAAGKYKRFYVHYKPTSGLYTGGTYTIEFDVRQVPEYPNKPPKAHMLTKVWHPNIDLQGAICHNYLKVDTDTWGAAAGWTPVLKMQDLVLAILTMFDYTNSEHHSDSFFAGDPLNVEAANEYMQNVAVFEKHAKEWVRRYATGHL
eukprot:TRINITY_DN17138_c0_g1_i1.p1 TRINITY_DN17138_c0_g1~~TRINITY_DN17138_c0_g1_i1.p1  ORF type:complete len:198 (-),score=57.29 TRINITY_DN17138_c0_g1_i1:172-765(-)